MGCSLRIDQQAIDSIWQTIYSRRLYNLSRIIFPGQNAYPEGILGRYL
jgi:hypothetical protein